MYYREKIITSYAVRKGITKEEAKKDLNIFLGVLVDCIKAGGVTFTNLFSIKPVIRKGRKGSVNGNAYETSDRKSLKITVGKHLDKELNE